LVVSTNLTESVADACGELANYFSIVSPSIIAPGDKLVCLIVVWGSPLTLPLLGD